MKNILAILSLTTLAAFNTNAQIKTADISVAITNPTTSSITVPTGDTILVSFEFTNNGPDTLPVGDSLFFYSGGIVLYSSLLQPFVPGSTIQMNNILYFYNPTDTTITGDICVTHIRQSAVILQSGGNPNTTYQDTVLANDDACFNYTFLGNSTSINGLVAGKLQFELSPNPATDFIEVSNIAENGTIEFAIINSLGQTVKTLVQNVTNKKTRLSIKDLPTGNYYVIQTANGRKASSSFIINH